MVKSQTMVLILDKFADCTKAISKSNSSAVASRLEVN